MEGFNDYYIYISSGFILLTFLIALKNFGHIRRISKHFSTKKFRINAFYEIDSSTSERFFVVSFYNTSISDSIITSLGFVYKDQNIDLYAQYCSENKINPSSKVIVPTKGSIRIKIDYENLKEIITSLNEVDHIVSKIETFTVDSVGFVSKRKAKIVRKILSSKLKIDKKNLLISKKNQIKKRKLELKQNKQEDKTIKKEKNKVAKELKKKVKRDKRLENKNKRRKYVKSVFSKTGLFIKKMINEVKNLFEKIGNLFKKNKETQ